MFREILITSTLSIKHLNFKEANYEIDFHVILWRSHLCVF